MDPRKRHPRVPSGGSDHARSLTLGLPALSADLDGTLYAIENGYEAACRDRVFDFMVSRLGVASRDAAREMWWPHFQKYNQTLRSLRAGLGFDFDKEDYWSYTRGDPRECLRANPDALAVLRTCDRRLRKYVLTNCAEKQAREALAALGLNGEFDGVFGADAMGDVCKPERAAFEKVMASAGIDPKTTAFFEDSVKNLAAAAELGMTTVLIRSHTAAEEGSRTDGFAPDFTIDAVTEAEVRRILPGLWNRA